MIHQAPSPQYEAANMHSLDQLAEYNRVAHLRRQQQPLCNTSATAYSELCNLLFSAWARTVRTRPTYARCARSLLTNTHQLWADQQACPTEYADSVRSVLVRLQPSKHRHPQGATAAY